MEKVSLVKKQPGERERISAILKNAIDNTNKTLNLNVKLGISIAFGDNYAQIH